MASDNHILLDTCAAIWIVEGEPISAEALETLTQAEEAASIVCVSPISAWEVGMLVSRGRLTASSSPEKWFSNLLSVPGIALADMSPNVLIASSFLPGDPPRDPADRIIIATAREFGLTVITRDRLLLNYADAGHMRAIAC